VINFWKHVSNLGIAQNHSQFSGREKVLSNQLNSVLLSIMLVIFLSGIFQTFVLKLNDSSLFDFGFSISIAFLTVINLWLNKNGHFKISRFTLTYLPLPIILILPVTLRGVSPEFYFWFPFIPLPAILLPVILYHYKREKRNFIFALLFPLLFMLLAADILTFFYTGPILPFHSIIVENQIYFRVIPSSIGLFTFFVVYSLQSNNTLNKHKINYQSSQLFSTISELKQTQRQLIEQEKMAVLGRMSSELTHEINTPISAIKGNLSMILTDQKTTKKLWADIKDKLTSHEHYVLNILIDDAISKSIKVHQNDEKEKIGLKIRKKLTLFNIAVERHDTIIEYFTEFGLEVKEDYKILLNHNQFEELLEIVFCEQSVHYSLSISHGAIEKAEKLISRLKSYNYVYSSVDKKPFLLNEMVENSLELLRSKLTNIKVHFSIDPKKPLILGYADEMIQVINNLIINAAQAMNYKGELWIRVFYDQDLVTLQIEDTGGGIHISNPKEIFTPFFTTKKIGEGSGLGLNICQQIIDKHQGSIGWHNTSNGTCFFVNIPAFQFLN